MSRVIVARVGPQGSPCLAGGGSGMRRIRPLCCGASESPPCGTARKMTRRLAKPRRRARSSIRKLHAEVLEVRLALSGQSLYGPSVGDGSALAAIAAVTTSAPTDEYMLIPDPQFIESPLNDTPGAALTEATSLIGLPAFRTDARFAGIDGSGYAVVIIDSGIDLDHPFFGPDTDGNGVADRIVYNA